MPSAPSAPASVQPAVTAQPLEAPVAPAATNTPSVHTSATPAATPSATPANVKATATPVPAVSASPAPAQKMFLSAQTLDYAGDRYTLIARGNVSLRFEDGTQMRGRYFAMDVQNNRFVIAGRVVITPKTGPAIEGAAYSQLLDFQRGYFLPVADGPDRWTFLANDFSKPLKGRENPGDAFALPDDPPGRSYIHARSAVILPRQQIRFNLGQLDTGLTVVPVPDYILNLSTNPHFAQNSLAGAQFDASYPFAGSPNASTVFHIRKAPVSGIFGAIEQRFVGSKGYAVGSISPLDKHLRQYNLLTSIRPTKRLQVEGFAQESAFQNEFRQPLNASAYLNGRITQALPGSYLQLNVAQYYQSLLGAPTSTLNGGCGCYGNNPDHLWVPNHPMQMQLSWIGFDQKVLKLPFRYRLRSGYGYAHDRGYGVLPVNGTNFGATTFGQPQADGKYPALLGAGVPTVTNSVFGGTLYSNPVRLLRDKHGNDLSFNATIDAQRQGFSLPHHIDTMSTSFSLGKTYGTRLATFLAYTVTNIRDDYGGQQAIAYAPDARLPAFNGFATNRALTESIIFTPSPFFNMTLTGQQNSDFPNPVFGVFGQAPSTITASVRAQLLQHLRLDVARTYYVGGFGPQRWNPQFYLLIGG